MNKNTKESGQVLALALVVLALILLGAVTLAFNSNLFYTSSVYSLESSEALSLAEAGVDKAVTTLVANNGFYSGEPETSLGNGSFVVTTSEVNPTTLLITSTGFVPNQSQSKAKRIIEVKVENSGSFNIIKGSYQLK